jgi:hypothetical protein
MGVRDAMTVRESATRRDRAREVTPRDDGGRKKDARARGSTTMARARGGGASTREMMRVRWTFRFLGTASRWNAWRRRTIGDDAMRTDDDAMDRSTHRFYARSRSFPLAARARGRARFYR